MAEKEIEEQEEEGEDLDDLDDSTDWKAKASELNERIKQKGIRQRERTKALNDKISDLERRVQELMPAKQLEKKSDEFGLLEKAYLGSRGITDADEVELFKKWAGDTKKPIDELVNHPFVTAELEKLRTAKANAVATDNVKGEKGASGAKDTPEYWIAKRDAKGNFPEDLPKDRKLRANIMRKLMEEAKSGKKFYNE